MYSDEYHDFKSHLYVAGLADLLWSRLDRLLVGPAKDLTEPLLYRRKPCEKCGQQASLIEVTSNYFLKYSGPGGSSGEIGRQITPIDAGLILDALAEPIDAAKLKNQFYDCAGFCPSCRRFYCAKCWSLSSAGYGRCPNGHGQSLDPHWSPED